VILVDTNAWVRHLRLRDARLVEFLRQGRVRTCDVVIGELLLGSGVPKHFVQDLLSLSRVPTPAAPATRAFIERHRRSFSASGVGWADAQIIHAAAQVGMRLHSTDRAVRKVCGALAIPMA
jgi:predicted nucleic acid-binding protein